MKSLETPSDQDLKTVQGHESGNVKLGRACSGSWFAADPSKAYFEKFSLVWAPLSMVILLAGVFGTSLYKHCDRNSYLAITVVGCLPGFLVPLIFPCEADKGRPLSQRFWVKGSLWIAIFGFYGNYFWTHYFYQLLGAEYLFDSYRFNDVPLVTFTATFFYFTFYFSFVNVLLRQVSYYSAALPAVVRSVFWWLIILTFSYGTALFEAVTIQHFPLYTYTERDAFLAIGSVVYGLYFVVGFPMFFSIDEDWDSSTSKSQPRTSLGETATNSLAATAIVTLLLDFWRLFLGSIYNLGSDSAVPLPFVYQTTAASAERKEVTEIGLSECTKVAQNWAQGHLSRCAKQLSDVVSSFRS